jgi:hypothetical protein
MVGIKTDPLLWLASAGDDSIKAAAEAAITKRIIFLLQISFIIFIRAAR